MQDAVVQRVEFNPNSRMFNIELSTSVTTKKLKTIARRLKSDSIVTKVFYRKGMVAFEVEDPQHREKGFTLLFNVIQNVLRRPKPRRKVREAQHNRSKRHKTTSVVTRR